MSEDQKPASYPDNNSQGSGADSQPSSLPPPLASGTWGADYAQGAQAAQSAANHSNPGYQSQPAWTHQSSGALPGGHHQGYGAQYYADAYAQGVSHAAPLLDPAYLRLADGRITRLASPSARIFGRLIDQLIIAAPIIFLSLRFDSFMYGHSTEMPLTEMFICTASVVVVAIVQLLLLYSRSQTIGKIIMKTKIFDERGLEAHGGQTIGMREFVFSLICSIPVVGTFIALANVFFLFSDRHQTLHDRLAKTIVALDPDQAL